MDITLLVSEKKLLCAIKDIKVCIVHGDPNNTFTWGELWYVQNDSLGVGEVKAKPRSMGIKNA